MRNRMRINRVLPAVPLLLIPSALNATDVLYDTSFGPLNVPTSLMIAVELPKFDGGLGVLESVELVLEAKYTGATATWDNEAPVPADVELGVGAEVGISALSALFVVAEPRLQNNAIGIAADSDGTPDFLGGDSFSVSGEASDSASSMSSAPGILAAFTGGPTDTFNVTIESLESTLFLSDDGFGPIDTDPGFISGTISVRYSYTPEPSTLIAVMLTLPLAFRRGSAPKSLHC